MKPLTEFEKKRIWKGWRWPWLPRDKAHAWAAVDSDGTILAVLIGHRLSGERATQELQRKYAECTIRECASVCVHHNWNLHDWQESAMFAAEEG